MDIDVAAALQMVTELRARLDRRVQEIGATQTAEANPGLSRLHNLHRSEVESINDSILTIERILKGEW